LTDQMKRSGLETYSGLLRRRITIKPMKAAARTAQMIRTNEASICILLF